MQCDSIQSLTDLIIHVFENGHKKRAEPREASPKVPPIF